MAKGLLIKAVPTPGISEDAAARVATAREVTTRKRAGSALETSPPEISMTAQIVAARPAGIQILTKPKVTGRAIMAATAVVPQITHSPMAQLVRKDGV